MARDDTTKWAYGIPEFTWEDFELANELRDPTEGWQYRSGHDGSWLDGDGPEMARNATLTYRAAAGAAILEGDEELAESYLRRAGVNDQAIQACMALPPAERQMVIACLVGSGSIEVAAEVAGLSTEQARADLESGKSYLSALRELARPPAQASRVAPPRMVNRRGGRARRRRASTGTTARTAAGARGSPERPRPGDDPPLADPLPFGGAE